MKNLQFSINSSIDPEKLMSFITDFEFDFKVAELLFNHKKKHK